jgi:hypothetical protein
MKTFIEWVEVNHPNELDENIFKSIGKAVAPFVAGAALMSPFIAPEGSRGLKPPANKPTMQQTKPTIDKTDTYANFSKLEIDAMAREKGSVWKDNENYYAIGAVDIKRFGGIKNKQSSFRAAEMKACNNLVTHVTGSSNAKCTLTHMHAIKKYDKDGVAFVIIEVPLGGVVPK